MRSAEAAGIRADAERVLAYLAATDAPPATPADAILGFGVFDLALPRFCAELHLRGLAPRLVFTGGIGAGTGDLGGPEADAWRAEVRRAYPQIPDAAFVLETRSTNTGENVRFTAELLARCDPPLVLGRELRSIIVVASPSRLRRAWLTLRHLVPGLRTHRRMPPIDFDREAALYARQGTPYLAHLAGELDRLVDYPRRGWIAAEPLPPNIVAAHARLRAAIGGDG